MTARRFVITCISHTDRTKFKTFKEIENGDVIAGWTSRPLVCGADLAVRFSQHYDFDNTIRLGRIVDIAPIRARVEFYFGPPFKLLPRLRITEEALDVIEDGHYLIQTDNSLLVVKVVTPSVQ